MEILFVTNSCSSNKYNEICRKRTREMIDPQQKFFRLLAEGFVEHTGVKVKVMPVLPLSASSYPQRFFHHEYEIENNVEYDYVPFYNGRLLRYITLFFSMFFNTLKWCRQVKNRGDAFLITDPLMMMAAMPARWACCIMGINTCALVTDVPSYVSYMKKDKRGIRRFIGDTYDKIAEYDSYRYDSYITLTESINQRINKKHRPYSIIEGVADINDTSINSSFSRVVLYAGGVYEMYGVKNLVKAFSRLQESDIELHIYGKGTYISEIEKMSRIDGRIKYMGCLSQEEIVKKEKDAMLLVNPRPCGEDFSKYSFPSKTMEYMLSGAPLVTTRLPGIPREYFDYIYFFEGDDEESIYNKLSELLSIDEEKLRYKGVKAHAFVINSKNNVSMAFKAISMLKTIGKDV